MPIKQYFEALDEIKPFVFRILTPRGRGTGFQIMYSKNTNLCGIATAYHVIAHEHEWEHPIKVQHYQSGKSLVLKHTQRAIAYYPDKDLAFILFPKADLPLKTEALRLIDEGKRLAQGHETGWCGFPAVAPDELCFFAGHISCYLKQENSYLIDGVAINGVSGGPAFYISQTNELKICGVISAYIPNMATGEALPGVSVVRSVKSYHAMLNNLKSLEDAIKKAKAAEERQKEVAEDRPKETTKTKEKGEAEKEQQKDAADNSSKTITKAEPKKEAILKRKPAKKKTVPKITVASRKQEAKTPAKKKSVRRKKK